MIPKAVKKWENFSKSKYKIIDLTKIVDNSVAGIKTLYGTGITLTDNEIKDIIKVIKPWENGDISSKGITRKMTSQEWAFLNFLRPLMISDLPLIISALTPLAKDVLLPFGLLAGMSATDAAIQKQIYGSGSTALMTSKDETVDIIKVVKSLEGSGLLTKRISEAIKGEAREQKGGSLPMLLGALAFTILGNAWIGRWVIKAGEGTISEGKNF